MMEPFYYASLTEKIRLKPRHLTLFYLKTVLIYLDKLFKVCFHSYQSSCEIEKKLPLMSLTLLLNKEKKCHEDPTLKNIIRIFNKHINFGKFQFPLESSCLFF